ncbi:hypothetical protein [Paenibacillus pabuli]|uniref:hypothetical protein n=1 Tax=Paenibacillus pabuli TaxID=1472 RepID=UPI00078508DC|nr:hypothetical protein [Paenibacillus pabuli]MEC0126531.1 hypothetical protein [Paenibacillus pabuli]
MKWVICLAGDEKELYELSKSLNTEKLTIFKEEGEYRLKSSDISSINDYKDVSKKVDNLVKLIDGVTKLVLGAHRKITVSDIYLLNDYGGRTFFMSAELSGSSSMTAIPQIIKADEAIVISNPADSVPDLLELCEKHEVIDKVIKLISYDDESWVGLYKIFEVIAKDADVKSFSSISSENLKRFTRTANSYKAIGMEARHALDYEPPKEPMYITEAKSLICLLVNEWIKQKK